MAKDDKSEGQSAPTITEMAAKMPEAAIAGEMFGGAFAAALNEAGVKVTPEQWAKAAVATEKMVNAPEFKDAIATAQSTGTTFQLLGGVMGAGLDEAGVNISPEQGQIIRQSFRNFTETMFKEGDAIAAAHAHVVKANDDLPNERPATYSILDGIEKNPKAFIAGEVLGAEFAAALNEAGVKVTPKQWGKGVAAAEGLLNDPHVKDAIAKTPESSMGVVMGVGLGKADVKISLEQAQKLEHSFDNISKTMEKERATLAAEQGEAADHNNITVPKNIPHNIGSTSKIR